MADTCPDLDCCYKILMVLDKDILEEQAVEAIKRICERCGRHE